MEKVFYLEENKNSKKTEQETSRLPSYTGNKLRRILEFNADEKQYMAFTVLSSNRESTTDFLQFSVSCVFI